MTSHSSQGQTADRALIHVDTAQGERLVNARMAYVSVSRGRYDAEIYTNDRGQLARDLSRDVSQRTATHEQKPAERSQGQEPETPQQNMNSQSVGQEQATNATTQTQSQGQGLGM